MQAAAATAPRYTPAEAIERACERIRQEGIAEARELHFERKKLVDAYKAGPEMFWAFIHPAWSTQEAIEDANAEIARIRNMPTRRRVKRAEQLLAAKRKRILARYFRMHGRKVWTEDRRAAA